MMPDDFTSEDLELMPANPFMTAGCYAAYAFLEHLHIPEVKAAYEDVVRFAALVHLGRHRESPENELKRYTQLYMKMVVAAGFGVLVISPDAITEAMAWATKAIWELLDETEQNRIIVSLPKGTVH